MINCTIKPCYQNGKLTNLKYDFEIMIIQRVGEQQLALINIADPKDFPGTPLLPPNRCFLKIFP